MKTMADVATDGLDVVAARGVVRVRDGQDTWLAQTAAYEAAVEVLAKRPVPADEDLDDAGMRAYSELCRLVSVASPVVSAIGSSRGTPEEQRGLVAVALGAELVDPDEAVVESLGEIAPTTPRVMDYQTGEVLDGQPSPELVEASLAAGYTGAVGARRDAEGVWQLVRDDPWGPYTRTVWIQE